MKRTNLVRSLMMTVLLASLCAIGLGIGAAAFAQEAAQPASQWKDRAEYDMFNAILAAQGKDNNQVVELADKYLAAYPESKFLQQVYELKLGAYQALNNAAKMEETGNKLLEVNPGNLRATLLLSYLFPRTYNATDPAKDEKLDKAAANAKAGLAALDALQPPPNVTPEQWKAQKEQSAAVLRQVIGFVALEKNDIPTAEEELRKSSESNPDDALGFYWLGRAYLSQRPAEYEKGIWAMARAVSISGPKALNDATKTQFKDYLTKAYEARHGSTEGLDGLLAQASSAPFPPDGFHIMTAEELAPPEPEPVAEAPKRELTVKPEELDDFSKIQAYLQAGGQKSEDTWEILKGQTEFALPGKVVSASPAAKPTKVLLAVSPELQLPAGAGKHDVELTLAAPYSKAIPAGTTINFEGTIDAFTPKPFLLKMVDGKIN